MKEIKQNLKEERYKEYTLLCLKLMALTTQLKKLCFLHKPKIITYNWKT